MTEIKAADVKELREKTGAGMMDCKKALAENKGDIQAAIDWLRKKGIASAAKKTGRTAAEGVVGALVSGKTGAVIELNSETDFVARNDKFQALALEINKLALKSGATVEQLKAASYPSTGRTIADEITENISVIGENLNLRRSAVLSVKQGVVTSYVHNAIIPGLGKIAVLVALESSAPEEKLAALAKQLAMHIAAAKPEALTTQEVSREAVEREKSIFSEQARASGKPDNIIEKMIEGRIRKYYEEVVLMEQPFIMDGKTKISDVIQQAAKEMGSELKLTGFIRYALGEGIEQTKSDFAQEVAAAVSGA